MPDEIIGENIFVYMYMYMNEYLEFIELYCTCSFKLVEKYAANYAYIFVFPVDQ